MRFGSSGYLLLLSVGCLSHCVIEVIFNGAVTVSDTVAICHCCGKNSFEILTSAHLMQCEFGTYTSFGAQSWGCSPTEQDLSHSISYDRQSHSCDLPAQCHFYCLAPLTPLVYLILLLITTRSFLSFK